MQNLREIANEKLRNNLHLRKAMLSLIADGEAIAFVGAGLSAPLNYPTWPKLLELLCAEAKKIGSFDLSKAASGDPLHCAEEIQQHFANHSAASQFKNILGREYGPRDHDNCTATHRLLVNLPFKAFVTSNYEESVEQALNEFLVSQNEKPRFDHCVIIKANGEDRHVVSRFLRSIVEGRGILARYVAHIHGCHNDAGNIILSASDYARAYGFTMKDGRIVKQAPASTLHRQIAWALFASRRLVFLGCSMKDPYIKALLDAVSTDLWEWDQPIHYVVLPLDENSMDSVDNQVAEFRRYGLQVVFFDNWDGNYVGLDQLLEEASQLSPRDNAPSVTSSVSAGTASTDHAAHTEVAPAPVGPRKPGEEVNLKWLEQVNEGTVPNLTRNED